MKIFAVSAVLVLGMFSIGCDQSHSHAGPGGRTVTPYGLSGSFSGRGTYVVITNGTVTANLTCDQFVVGVEHRQSTFEITMNRMRCFDTVGNQVNRMETSNNGEKLYQIQDGDRLVKDGMIAGQITDSSVTLENRDANATEGETAVWSLRYVRTGQELSVSEITEEKQNGVTFRRTEIRARLIQ